MSHRHLPQDVVFFCDEIIVELLDYLLFEIGSSFGIILDGFFSLPPGFRNSWGLVKQWWGKVWGERLLETRDCDRRTLPHGHQVKYAHYRCPMRLYLATHNQLTKCIRIRPCHFARQRFGASTTRGQIACVDLPKRGSKRSGLPSCFAA